MVKKKINGNIVVGAPRHIPECENSVSFTYQRFRISLTWPSGRQEVDRPHRGQDVVALYSFIHKARYISWSKVITVSLNT